MGRLTQVFNFPAMLAVMGLLFWMLLTDCRVTRREGGVLLAVYVAYLLRLVGITIAAAV
jgi:Ca2+/Na+ antiporter